MSTQAEIIWTTNFQGGEREPNLCLGAELASYDEVKVGNVYISQSYFSHHHLPLLAVF